MSFTEEDWQMKSEDNKSMKEKLIKLAKESGFVSNIISSTPWKYSTREDDRYMMWMTSISKWLRETHDCHVYIRPEPYNTGINLNWQVLFYNSQSVTCWDDRSTGLYGDNGEYKTYESALEAGLHKALELIQEQNPKGKSK